MVKPVTEYTKTELEEKIEAIKAERERTANALKRYEEELERRKHELPLGVPCDGKFYISWDGVVIEDREEKASKVNFNSFDSRESAEKHADMLLDWRKDGVLANAKGEQIDIKVLLPLLPKGWVAMDALGLWCWYYKKPDRDSREWINNSVIPSERLSAFNLKRYDDWHESVMECGL